MGKKRKGRLGVCDCRALVGDVRRACVGRWVQNVYNVTSKMFLLKLTKPDTEKVMLVLESGVRFHTTQFERAKDPTPSGFSMKLRKHIRGRKLVAVRQVGVDRIIDFEFGYGETACHIILELYASGNVILTDREYNILTLLRAHVYRPGVKVAPRDKAEKEKAATKKERKARAKAAKENAAKSVEGQINFAVREKYPIGSSNEEAGEALYDDPGALGRELAALVQRTSENDKIKKMPALEKLLSGRGCKASALGPDLVAHVVRESGVHIDDALDQSGHPLAAVIENIAARLNDAWVLLRGLDAADASKGYVYADAEGKVCHFAPVRWAHRNNEACSEHPTLDRAVDAYFSEMEMKKDARDEDGARKRALKK